MRERIVRETKERGTGRIILMILFKRSGNKVGFAGIDEGETGVVCQILYLESLRNINEPKLHKCIEHPHLKVGQERITLSDLRDLEIFFGYIRIFE